MDVSVRAEMFEMPAISTGNKSNEYEIKLRAVGDKGDVALFLAYIEQYQTWIKVQQSKGLIQK